MVMKGPSLARFVPHLALPSCWQDTTINHHHCALILANLAKATVDMIFMDFQDLGIYSRVGDPELDFQVLLKG